MSDHTLYAFGPLERRGILLGLDGGQLAVLGVATMLAVAAFGAGAPFVPVLVASGLVGFVTIRRVRGRPMLAWLTVVARFAVQRRRWRSDAPTAGATQAPGAEPDPDFDPSRDWPPELQGVEIIEHIYEKTGGPVGVIVCDGGWHAIMRVTASSWALDDLAKKEARLSRWASTLSQLARDTSPVTRIQWIERTEPDDGSDLVRHLAEEGHEDLTPLGKVSFDSYRALLAGADVEQSVSHDVLLVVRIDPSRRRRAWKELGGKDEGACRMLMQVLERLYADLDSQGLTVVGVLPPRLVAGVIRTAYDPGSRALLAQSALTADREGVDPRRAAPAATDREWDRYITHSAQHRTYWVEEWPRIPITAQEALADVILRGSGVAKTMSVIFEPVPIDIATKAAEEAVAADEADEGIRSKRGFRTTARRRRQAEAAVQREAELSMGYAEMRYSGWITVSADIDKGLDKACDEVENAAQLSGLRLQACNGEQRSAFAHTLPLCRGLG